MIKIYKLFLTLGVGFLPKKQGTFGSILSVIVFALVWDSDIQYSGIKRVGLIIIVAIVIYLLSLWSMEAMHERGVKFKNNSSIDFDPKKTNYDDSHIVVDEFLGMLFACLPFFLANEFSWILLISGFVLFRFFDGVKPWFIRKIDSIDSPHAVLLDDIAAGILSAIVLSVIIVLLAILPFSSTYISKLFSF